MNANIHQLEALTLSFRRSARQAVGVHNSCPVEVIDGNAAPTVVGESWHYETRGGQPIYHPSAYSKRGWSNMVYCPSTLRVQVGAAWRA